MSDNRTKAENFVNALFELDDSIKAEARQATGDAMKALIFAALEDGAAMDVTSFRGVRDATKMRDKVETIEVTADFKIVVQLVSSRRENPFGSQFQV